MTGKNLRKIIQKLLLMCHLLRKEYIIPAYISKQNPDHGKQIIISMIPSGEGWHYIALKNSQYYQEQ